MKKYLILFTVLLIVFSCNRIQGADRISIDVKAGAEAVNKMSPFMVDAETRLDNATPLPNNTLQYNYTLVNITKDMIDVESFEAIMKPQIVNNVRTNPQMEHQRKNKWTLIYFYKDKEGNHIVSITVTPEDYK